MWSEWERANMFFCESAIEAWIRQPINTWSNLAVICMGLFLMCHIASRRHIALQAFGYIVLFLGLGSFLFHASETRFGELLDLAGMYMVTAYALALGVYRAAGDRRVWIIGVFTGALLAQTLCAVLMPKLGSLIFAVVLLSVVVIEVLLIFEVSRIFWSYKPLFKSLGVLGIAFGFWVLDYTKIWCDPHNHYLQGHALWHVLCAVSMYYYYKFAQQFFGESTQP